MSAEIQQQLCSSAKLDRDKAYVDLQSLITSLDEEGIEDLQSDFIRLLGQVTDKWETRHGALSGCKALLDSNKSSDDFAIEVLDHALQSLDDTEFRVRIVAGKSPPYYNFTLGIKSPLLVPKLATFILDTALTKLVKRPS